MKAEVIISVGPYKIPISNPKKIFFPDEQISKIEFVNYYKEISPLILPYTKQRPIAMQRFPDGVTAEGFFQKDASKYFPKWVDTIPIAKKDGNKTNYVICNKKATLVYLASQACITPHLWLSKIKKLEYPDQMIFDLDPSNENFEIAREIAFLLKELLESIGLIPFAMLTGSKGIHVRIPIVPNLKNDEVQGIAYQIAAILMEQNPNKITLNIQKHKRENKLFLDTYRNSYSATAVAPYAVRAKPNAPIATPISWDELKNKKLNSQSFKIGNIFKRIENIDDPWSNFFSFKKNLKDLHKNL